MPAPCVGTKLKGGDFVCDSVQLAECSGSYTACGIICNPFHGNRTP